MIEFPWGTEVQISHVEDGWRCVYARCLWPTVAECEVDMDLVLHGFADNRRAFIRQKPWAKADRDYETQTDYATGGCRFMFKLEAGEWKYPKLLLDDYGMDFVSLASLKEEIV